MGLLENPFDPAREAALVTGAGNGIGRAIAQALVGEGVRTVFADISAERVAAAIREAPRPATRCWPTRRPRSGRSPTSSTAPRRRGARPIMRSRSTPKPGSGCAPSMSMPAFIWHARWRLR